MVILPGCRHQIHRAKAAGVVERNPRPTTHMKNDMVMLGRGRVRLVKFTDHMPRDQHPARHAQVDQQCFRTVEINEDIFGSAAQAQNPFARQPLCHPVGKGPPQVWPVDIGARDHLLLHHGGYPGLHCFNFGQFGHTSAFACDNTLVHTPQFHPWHNDSLSIGSTGYNPSPIAFARKHDMTDQPDNTTHFGFETVREDEKAGRVQGVFSSVASKYDIMNDVMSVGIHRVWKDAMMDWLAPRGGQRLLDVAGGTGDIAFRFLKRASHGHATVLDLTEPMLIEGRKRAEAARMSDSLDWVVGDAMALPFEANTFDVYTISFGIRNVTRPQDALAEAYRVLKPGGRLMVLEFSQLPNPMIQAAYDAYSFNVIPRMGQMIAGDRDSYQYLVESIRKFPDQDTFLGMIRTAGFGNAKYRNLSMGIAALHSGWKL